MKPTAIIVAVAITCFLLGIGFGWVLGQDSTRCAGYRGERVCIQTITEDGTTRAYDPEEGR